MSAASRPRAISLGQYRDRVSKRARSAGESRQTRLSGSSNTPRVSRLWYPTAAHFVTSVHNHHQNALVIDNTTGRQAPQLADCVAAAGVWELAERDALRRKYEVARLAIATLHHPSHFFRVCAFVRHGIGPVDFVTGEQKLLSTSVAPPPIFEVAPFLQKVKCRMCCEQLLRPDDVCWNDDRQIWACEARMLVPFDGSFCHPACLSTKAHV